MPAPVYETLPHASYLDLTSFQGNAPLPSGSPLAGSYKINVALVLERANDPTDLLAADWATRQKGIAALEASGTLWTTYGADKHAYDKVLDDLDQLGIPTFYVEGAPPNGQYVSSPESRTIWVQVDETSFTTLFGPSAVLRDGGVNGLGEQVVFWEGDLSLPKSMIDAGVVGLWFDTGMLSTAILADPGSGPVATLPEGPQSPGNGDSGAEYPNEIAARYNFPFADPDLAALAPGVRIGLIEPGQGSALPGTASGTFDELLHAYREAAGITTALPHTITVAPGGQTFANSGERSMDVGIVTTVDPNARIILYAGSGSDHGAGADAFTTYQAAIWDTVNHPDVVSSSFRSYPYVAPGSPFAIAASELYVDAALRNITMVNAMGDGGSGDEYANGLTNVSVTHMSPFSVVVGGGSLNTIAAADADKTLTKILDKALAGDPATIWQMVNGGLKVMPSAAAQSATFVETVWNGYTVRYDVPPGGQDVIAGKDGKGGGLLSNSAGSGGIDISQPPPAYQIAFGLADFLVTSDPRHAAGRGAPDVSATSGGNMKYLVPWPDLEVTDGAETTNGGGTSAAAPLWAALLGQVDAIFADQNLPRLGYMNDLLYIAAVIAPASFNDVTIGNNTSSFVLGGPYDTPPNGGKDPTVAVTPTGYGYEAGPGYDLTTGLGTPNGVLLARALTAIAHTQMAGDAAALEATAREGVWRSPVKQSLLVQVATTDEVGIRVDAGDKVGKFESGAADAFAWTDRFAQQVLQPDFDPALVRMFDGQAQGALSWQGIKAGAELSVAIDKVVVGTPQGTLSASYGFVDYISEDGSAVRVARPVAVAHTVGSADDQVAVVRMRQGSEDKMSLKLYRVDDFKGRIDGLKPGSDGYNAAANARAYETASGKDRFKGPGYGEYREKQIVGVDSGDIVAMKIKTGGEIYWAFARANEKHHGEKVGHLWNYGLDTWGWESGRKGGDHDFNDLVVQIDFTSAYGHGWLL